ncbi:hypothetical protein [Burkholderia ubonensis]|uniref:hypothetical protein n=1 Tax=Burkholderia ubonensis TaxID=101571 RepID=UPI000AC85D6F|nr:hypothetical protein [Burkholderia ubonensis]
MIFVHCVVRLFTGGAGLLLLYVAWFIYDDEEKRLQNKIELWWVEFDDSRKRMMTRQAAFASVISRRASGVIDRIFRGTMSSTDSIATAACLSIASVGFVVSEGAHRHAANLSTGNSLVWYGSTLGLVCMLCGSAPAFFPSLRWLPKVVLWLALIYLLLLTALFGVVGIFGFFNGAKNIYFGYFTEAGAREYNLIDMPAWFFAISPIIAAGGLAMAITFTLISASIVRSSLARVAETGFERPILARLLVILAPVGLCVIWLNATNTRFSAAASGNVLYALDAVFAFTFGASAIVGISLLLLVAVAILMVVHRVAWPLMCRLLYNLPRHRIVENKKALNGVGVALLVVAIKGGDVWPGWGNFLSYMGKFFGL